MMRPITGPEQIVSADSRMEVLLMVYEDVLLRCPNGEKQLKQLDAAADPWSRIDQMYELINDELSGMDLVFWVNQTTRMVEIIEIGADYYQDIASDLVGTDDIINLLQPTAQERLLNFYLLPAIQANPAEAVQLHDILSSLGTVGKQIAGYMAQLIQPN